MFAGGSDSFYFILPPVLLPVWGFVMKRFSVVICPLGETQVELLSVAATTARVYV